MSIFSVTKFFGRVVILLVVFLRVASAFGESSASEKTNTTEIFISPKGNDNHPGTVNAPLKSLEKAKQLARFILNETSGSTVIISVGHGMYPLEQAVVFSCEDFGDETNRIIVKASENAKPVFTGSRRLSEWEVLKDKSKCEMLPAEAKNNIFVTDLKRIGILDYGNPIEPGNRPELFCNGQLQSLSRWPNHGFAKAGLVKGPTELPPTFMRKRGAKEGLFEYTDQRQNRWAAEKEVYLGGYWFWDWADEFQQVSKIDTILKILHLAEPYHHYGFKDSLSYFGLNLFCELDQPGEWYLNRTEGKLYWYPPIGVNPNKAMVTLSVFNAPFMVELKDCSNVTIEGLTFQESRGSAVFISGGKNCLVKDCRFERFGRDGIQVDGGLQHGVSGCLVRTLGFRGIDMKGGNRQTLEPANHFIENTLVEHFSLFKRTYEPAVHLDGCGMRVSNNRFRYSSSSAMRLEGNDFTIEYNDVSHVVNESDDQGALDMWYNPSYRGVVVRYNRWADITGGTHSGAAGVRLDDMISGVLIFGNIFERCGSVQFGGVQIHGGKDNLVENNLFYKCNAAVTFHRWGEERWLKELDTLEIQKKIYEDVDTRSSQYLSKYPELKFIRENADVNTVKNNLIVDCKNQFLRNKAGIQILIDNRAVDSEGKTAEQCCTSEFLARYGLSPIPFHQIGPKNNTWIE
ncbi:right-handed parallel beta-helix repeat-containing protein [Gaoshiqia sp. Z1-71]|uniref:right-handed parallel beta-helix repeat-containing protein n=1 Tax=Gaoshiqia hydrogeniformans TaxID=3290090 RepID=UPI003BF8E3E5